MLVCQVEALGKKINGLNFSMKVNPVMQCDAIGAGMINLKSFPFKPNMEHDQVNFMGNNSRPQNNPHSNNHNPGWRNHPNFSWDVSETRFQNTETTLKNQQASIKGLENQIG
ncbi:integrase [Gossypium australe]|uniref:Integrase n=1 Tax=Gossypium australe TaxID=47621 RepID=A0A5B6VP78_9ROSI|nr:integrase [Gossypium australe]